MSKDEGRANLGEVVTRRGWSQRMLAARSGVSVSHVSAYLAGTRKDMGFSKITALARALGVSLNYLAGLPPRTPGELDPYELELLDNYRALQNEAVRESTLDFVRHQVELDKKMRGEK